MNIESVTIGECYHLTSIRLDREWFPCEHVVKVTAITDRYIMFDYIDNYAITESDRFKHKSLQLEPYTLIVDLSTL